MELIHAINEWAAAIGMRPVEADEAGGFTLLFDGVHEVSFAPDGDGNVFHAEVGDVERLDREGALSLLEASLLGAGTGGAAFEDAIRAYPQAFPLLTKYYLNNEN